MAEDADLKNQEITDLVDKAELDYLEKRSSLNKAVLDINAKMSAINTQFKSLIEEIINTNEDLLEQNRVNLRETDKVANNFSEYLEASDRKKLKDQNLENHEKVFEQATVNQDLLEEVYDRAASNKAAFDGLRSKIEMQKEQIERLWAHIEAQQELCFDLINET